jgi:hypothetical protein
MLHPDFAAMLTEWMKMTVLRMAPEAGHRPLYGGLVFERALGLHKTLFCGLYMYTEHAAIEFGQGARLHDPLNMLEGAGKLRRRIKLRSMGDILAKDCEGYILQAYMLDQPRL